MSGPLDNTDAGNAKRFASQRGGVDIIYVPEIGWHVWDGIRWQKDRLGLEVELAKMVSKSIVAEAQDKETMKWAIQSLGRQRLVAMLELAKSEESVAWDSRCLDMNQWLLNCTNVTVDLRTGDGRPALRIDKLTKAAATEYNSDAQCPVWLAFLDKIMGGDQEMISFLQRAVGYSLTGSVREDALFILYGGGSNGKTTFVTAIMEAMGDYATKIPIEALLHKNQGDIPCDIAMLRGARFASASESDEGRRLSEATIKSLTSRDKIPARFMHQNFFHFDPTHKLWIDTNHKPVVRGSDFGLWRRVNLIPFTIAIAKEHQDKDLADKLKAEYPGIIKWAIEGCVAWQAQGLNAPAKVVAATELYRKEMDSIGAFLDEECVKIPGATIGSADLYKAYAQWATENGEHPRSNKAFSMAVEDRGFVKRHTKFGKEWSDLDLAHGRVAEASASESGGWR